MLPERGRLAGNWGRFPGSTPKCRQTKEVDRQRMTRFLGGCSGNAATDQLPCQEEGPESHLEAGGAGLCRETGQCSPPSASCSSGPAGRQTQQEPPWSGGAPARSSVPTFQGRLETEIQEDSTAAQRRSWHCSRACLNLRHCTRSLTLHWQSQECP